MELTHGIPAEHLLADRAYDSNLILEQAEIQGMKVVIPPKKNRKQQREYDKYLYKMRHLIENAFLQLKRWRAIATRYTQFISDYRLYSFKIIINSAMHAICDNWPRLIKKAVNFLLKFFARSKKLIISCIFVHNFPQSLNWV